MTAHAGLPEPGRVRQRAGSACSSRRLRTGTDGFYVAMLRRSGLNRRPANLTCACSDKTGHRTDGMTMTEQQHDKILIIDFGSQVTQLIARRVREEGVYSEIVPFQSAEKAFAK